MEFDFASQAVINVAKKKRFDVFVPEYKPFTDEENCIFIRGTHDDEVIRAFIDASDAMLHARWEGETFGLSCGEYLISGKPIITWGESRERNHILMADRSAIIYNHKNDLETILLGINQEYINWKAGMIDHQKLIRDYGKENVSKKLKAI